MNPTLYLHMGHGRCGSSSIQRFAAKNKATLDELGVYYPSPAEMGIDTPYKANANAYPLYRLRQADPSPVDLLREFLERQEHPKVLLSSESLLTASPAFIRRVVDTARSSGTDVVGLAYVREQREWLISRYAQAIKARRWTISLGDFLAKSYHSQNLDYQRLFSTHAEIFGRENLVVRVFERPKLLHGDVRADAFNVLGIDVQDLITDDPRANASASIEEIEVMRFLIEHAERRQFSPREFLLHPQSLWQETGWEPTRDLYRLAPPELLREMGAHFSSRNEEFRREYFPDEPAPLFSTTIPDDYQQLSENEWMNPRSFGLLAYHLVKVLDGRRAKRLRAKRLHPTASS